MKSILFALLAVVTAVYFYHLTSSYYKSSTPAVGVRQKIVVTGASMGLGSAIAKEFIIFEPTNEVVLAARSEGLLKKLKAELLILCNNQCVIHVVVADLSTHENCEKLIFQANQLMNGIDYLILNHIAGARYGAWLQQENQQDFLQNHFQVNAFSYISLATAAIPLLQQSQHGGGIAVVSSLAGHVGTPYLSVYSSTKHALHGFFDALRTELAQQHYLLRDKNENNNDKPISNSAHPITITICSIGSTDTEGAAKMKQIISNNNNTTNNNSNSNNNYNNNNNNNNNNNSSSSSRSSISSNYNNNKYFSIPVDWEPPERAAKAIVTGVYRKQDTVTYPYYSLTFVTILHKLRPVWVQQLLLAALP